MSGCSIATRPSGSRCQRAGSGAAEAEAKKIDDKVSRWTYAIPAYKANLIKTKLADLLEPAKGS